MTLKQENASDDSAAVIEKITAQYRAIKLPYLADTKLYLGTPFSILEGLSRALAEQLYEDDKKKFKNRLRYAGIIKERSQNTFFWDDDTYPMAEPGVIERVLTIEFLRQHKNLVVLGPPGVGKSMLVTIVACKAVREGFSLKYKTSHDIALELKESKTSNNLSGYIKKLYTCDVLVIEDATFTTFNLKTSQAFFSIMDKRYQGCKSTVITSNGSISEWAAKFPDISMSSAILGRFYENSILVNMNGAVDFRLKQAKGLIENTGAV